MKTASLFLCLSLAACGPDVAPPEKTVAHPVSRSDAEGVVGDKNQTEPLVVPEISGEKIKVALLLPLSGPDANVGRALLRSATMALFDAYDPRLVLLPIDTKADVQQTELATQEALDRGVSIVLGPLLAANVEAAGNILKGTGVPLVGFSNDSSVAAPGRFIMGFLPELEVKRVVDYAISLGLREYAALLPDGRYGARVREAFGDAVSGAGAQIAAIENYPPDPDAVFEPVKRLSNYDRRRKEMRDEIRFLRSLRDDMTDEIANKLAKSEVLEGVSYDAVLVPEGGELLKTLAPLLPFYEIDPNKIKLLGTGLWNDESLLREPPLQGAYFAAPAPKTPNAFLARYEKTYDEKPPRIATLAYDAMSLVALLARADPIEDENGVRLSNFSVEALRNPEGFSGLDGLFRFLPDGTAERLLAVLEINRRGFKVVDPALNAFPRFGYALRQSASQE
ncbi:MAG: penicillin-binding protein activator [Kordiimonadaceae bacterium]|nr:penicillin-binding protein activator [Kordiimonadaceae bacterium]